jgi:hypothetical protein
MKRGDDLLFWVAVAFVLVTVVLAVVEKVA